MVTNTDLRGFLLALLLISLILPLAAAQDNSAAKKTPHLVEVAPADPEVAKTATHLEIDPIGTDEKSKFADLSTFCLDAKENILACDSKAKLIKVISPKGKLLNTFKLDFDPYVICTSKDGSIYVAGWGIVARLDAKGKIIKTIEVKSEDQPEGRASGIAVTQKDVFVCFGSSWSLRSTSNIYRFDTDLANKKQIATGMRGCCQRLDIVTKKNTLYVAENTRHRVVKLDRDGKELAKWGSRTRDDVEGFGSCCNPMNLAFGVKGELYTAESGLGRVKRYSPDGKFLSLVGYVGTTRFNRAGRTAASCSNITVAPNKDGSKIYVLDFSNNLIRVLQAKKPTAADAGKKS